jgi:seryl-tRNA synthetase
MQFALEKLRKKGFIIMIPPTILREKALIGSGHFPEAKDEIYQIANPGRIAGGEETKEKFYLGGTSEPALLAYYADTILEEKKLPIKMAGFSSCYRSEAGSYGKDTKGLYRLHEFMKIEQVVLCHADLEKSHKLFEEIGNNAKEILQELKLPYRVVQVCTGDMGAGKYEMQDVETWMPSRDSYGETHSDSALTDWQARRLNIKYRIKNNEKKIVYTLNNTMIASPRILISILENYQQKDGSVKIPKVLQKYVGAHKIEKKND